MDEGVKILELNVDEKYFDKDFRLSSENGHIIHINCILNYYLNRE